jgi:hypothetical protein
MSYNEDLASAPVSTVLAARDTVVALMDSKYPGKGWAPGGQLEALVVEPLATGLGTVVNEAEGIRAANSLADAATAEDTETVDRLLANYGVSRADATQSSGNVVVVTTAPAITSIGIDTVLTSGNQPFRPIMAYRVYPAGVRTPDPLNGIGVFTPRADGNYEFIIAVRSDNTGSAVRIASNAAFTISGVIPGLVSINAVTDFAGGVDAQTTADAVAIAKQGIIPSTFSGSDSIEKMIAQTFPGFAAAVVGAGHACMTRDRDNLFGLSCGGKIDVYVRSAFAPMTKTVQVTASLFPVNRLSKIWSFKIVEPGAYKVTAIRPADVIGTGGYRHATDTVTPIPPTTGFVPKMVGVDALFTAHQQRDITFVAPDLNYAALLGGVDDNELVTKVFDVDVLYMPSIADVDAYVRGSPQRDPGADLLVHGALPVIVDVSIVVRGTVDSAARAAVSDAISGLGLGVDTIPASLIYDALRSHVKGNVGTVNFRAEIIGRDLQSRFINARAELSVPADAANGISAESITFLTSPSRISIEAM